MFIRNLFTYGTAGVQESVTLRNIVLPYLEMSDMGRGGGGGGCFCVVSRGFEKHVKVEYSPHFEVRFS